MARIGYLIAFLLGFVTGIVCVSSFFVHYPVQCKVLDKASVWDKLQSLREDHTDLLTKNKTDDESDNDGLNPTSPIAFNDSHLHEDDTSIAERLFQEIRILCLVMTYPENHLTKAIHVNATWGQRCTKLLFVTRLNDTTLPTLVINVEDGRRRLGNKTRETFYEVYAKYLEEFDWFIKADDDTYVIMENLRYFLSAQSHKEPVYFGYKFVKHAKQGYPSGGAAYVVSRKAVTVFGEKSRGICKFDSGSEDEDFGICMEEIGVRFENSVDSLGRTRFHCFQPQFHLLGRYPKWFSSYDKFKGERKGVDSLSDYAISFHYIAPELMYVMEYFLYHLSPYGIIKGLQNLNSNSTIE